MGWLRLALKYAVCRPCWLPLLDYPLREGLAGCSLPANILPLPQQLSPGYTTQTLMPCTALASDVHTGLTGSIFKLHVVLSTIAVSDKTFPTC